jgi:Fic family protein
MDTTKFTSNKTGQLVEITTNLERDWAFVPNPLPPQWKFPETLWPMLVDARVNLARLDGIGRTLPDPELLLRPLQNREALRSSSLEGTYASPQELLLFEKHPRAPKSERDPANAWLEVSNYSKSLKQGVDLLNSLPLSLRLIKELHKTLLSGVRGKDKAPGEFRRLQVHIGSDRRYIPPPPESMHNCLNKFEERLNQEDPNFDLLIRCFVLHYQFEAIHPFRDGNGRVGRVLLALMIYQWCNLSAPWLYMSAFYEQFKDEYINNLFNVSAKGDWQTWIEFCLRGTIEQTKDSIRRCEELKALKENFLVKAGTLGVRMHAIIEQLFSNPLVTIPSIKENFGVSYPSAQKDVERLVEAKILQELSLDIRPKSFFAPDIIRIAYRETESL